MSIKKIFRIIATVLSLLTQITGVDSGYLKMKDRRFKVWVRYRAYDVRG
jgi:hypothetical protein